MKKTLKLLLSLMLLFFIDNMVFSQDEKVIIEDFSKDAGEKINIHGWEEKSFVGHTTYSIIEIDGNHVLHAEADSAASGLYKKMEYDPGEWPVLSWRWKVTHLPEKGDVRSKETDDYGARVYVVFPHFLKWRTKTISYIWAKKLPKGEQIPNAWLPKNVVMIAVQSGNDSLGHWITEKHNVYQDYKKIFGDDPPDVGAVAIMSDGDNTGGKAEAYYDDLMLLNE